MELQEWQKLSEEQKILLLRGISSTSATVSNF